MAFAAVASGTSTRGLFGDTSIVLSKPAAAAVGHLAVVVFHQESDSPGVTVTAPSGWTMFAESFNTNSTPDSRQRLYYKILDAGDVAGSSFTWSWSGTIYGGGCLSLFSADGTITLGTLGAFINTNNSSSSTTVIPAVTTDQDGALVVGTNDDWQERTVTWPSPMTETVDINGCAIAYNVQATAGTTGTVTITHDGGNAYNNSALSTFNEAPVAGAVHLSPDGDITVNTWTTDTGGTTNLYQAIDEGTASDTDYVQSVANPASIIYECTLENGTDPAMSSGHTVRVRALIDAAIGGATTLRTEVRQGASALSTPAFWDDVLTPSAQTFEHTLSGAQTDAITDYADLRYRFTATQAAVTSSPTFVAAGTFASTATNAATFTPGLPSGVATDDVLVLVVMRKDTTTTLTSPSGWTQQHAQNTGTTNRTEVWWRRMTAGFTAQALTFGSSTILRGGQMYAVRGCPTSGSPFAQTSAPADATSINQNTASSTTVNLTQVTPAAASGAYLGLIVAAVSSGPTTLTAPGGWVTGVMTRSGNGGIAIGYTRRLDMTAGSATGASTVTVGTAGVNAGVTLTFRAAASNSRARVTWAELEVPELLTGYPAEVMADAPLGYWRLGEASGSVAADTSGNGHQGTYFGGVTYGVTGAVDTSSDTAVTLDGTSGYASVPSTGLTLGTGPATMECWASITSGYSGNPRMLAFGANIAWELFLDGANRHLNIFNFNGGVTDTGFTFAFDTLYHVVLTVDASNIIVYIDGAVVFNPAFSSAASNSGMALYIGQSGNAADWWKGTLDEVAIYGTALSPTRVSAHYAASQAGVTFSPSPVSGAAAVVAPSVVQASLSLTPAPVAAAAASINPTVQAHAIVTPSPAAAATGIVNPTLAPNAVSLPFVDAFTGAPDAAATIVDTSSLIDVVDNRLYFENGGSANWTGHRYSHGPFVRADLGAICALVRATNYANTGGGYMVSASPSSTDPNDAGAVEIHSDNQGAGNYKLWAAETTDIQSVSTRSIDYLYSIVARPGGGFFCVVSGGEYGAFPNGTLVNLTATEADAQVWLHVAANQARFHLDYVKALPSASVPTALSTRFGGALAADTFNRGSLGTTTEVGTKSYVTSGSPVISSNALSVPNGATLVFDPGARARCIELTITSASSNFAIYFRNNGTTVNSGPAGTGYSAFLDTSASGIYNEGGGGVVDQTGAFLWPGGTHRVRIIDDGARARLFVDNTDVLGGWTTLGSYASQYGVGIFNYSGAAITIDDWGAWAASVTLTSDFGAFPSIPAGNGSATISETFPGADGAALPGTWTAHSGTWEQRSGRAQMTAASVNGIATLQTSLTDHEIKGTLVNPSTTPAYPLDWYNGLFARYVDTTHWVMARKLRQDGSNEIEVQENAGAGGVLIGYVNLGTIFSASGSNVLALAVNGAEVSAYLDGELVVQATTTQTTGTRAGIGVQDNNPSGQPSWDDIEVRATGLAPLVISPSAVAGGTALNGPVVIQATLTLAPAAAAAPASVVAPVAVQASLSLNGGVVASAASLVNPTVRQASLTLSVVAAIARALGLDPAIIAGGGIAAGIVSSAASVVAPSVVQASLSLAGGNVSSAAAVVDPAIGISTNPITPSPAAAATSTTGALVVGGPVAVSPSPAVSSAQSVAPAIVQTSLTLAGGAVVSRALLVNPAVLAQMLYAPSPVTAGSAIVQPAAVQASLVLSAQVAAAASVVAPTIIQTSVVYAPVFADARTQLAGPLVSVGALFVNAGIASGATSVVAPTVQRGAIVYTPVAVASGAYALAGQVVYSALTLSAAPAVARSSTLTGFAGAGSLTVIPLALSVSAATFGGAVVYGSILLSPLPVVGAVGVSPVVVVYGAIVIIPPAVEAGTETLSPRIVFFNAGEMTVTERTGGLLVVEQRGPSMGITERDPDMHIEYRP